MPSFYTQGVQSGEVTSLREFILICARAMNALYIMRDKPAEMPIPKRLEPDTKYYDERLAEANARLKELRAMSVKEKVEAAAAYNTSVLQRNAECVAQNEKERKRYTDMIEKVRAWENPPEGLKDFMLEQLENGRSFDTTDKPYQGETFSAPDWYDMEVEQAVNNIAYYMKQANAIIARTEENNRWLEKLHTSLEGLEDDTPPICETHSAAEDNAP